MKTCCTCKEEKSLEDFYKNNKSKDGIELGWTLEQSVYAEKGSWARAVRVILGLANAPSEEERQHACREGLQVMVDPPMESDLE